MKAKFIVLIIFSATLVRADMPACEFDDFRDDSLYCYKKQDQVAGYLIGMGTLEENRKFETLNKLYLSWAPSLRKNRRNLLDATVKHVHIEAKGKTYIVPVEDSVTLEKVWELNRKPLELVQFLAKADGGNFKDVLGDLEPNQIRLVGTSFKEPIENVTRFDGDGYINDKDKVDILASNTIPEKHLTDSNSISCHFTESYGAKGHKLKIQSSCLLDNYAIAEVDCIDRKLNTRFTSLVSCNEMYRTSPTKCLLNSKIGQTKKHSPLKKGELVK